MSRNVNKKGRKIWKEWWNEKGRKEVREGKKWESKTSNTCILCAVGSGFFSSVSTCLSLEWSKDLTSALESMDSSLISETKPKYNIALGKCWLDEQ